MLTDDAIPVAQPVRQVWIACRAAVEKEVEQMVNDDIWEGVTTSSAWALNLNSLQQINDLHTQLQGASMFTKLDLLKEYFHISLAPESHPLTTTITPYGLFQYKHLPMGLTDATSVFQCLVPQTPVGWEGCISYLEDILVFHFTAPQQDEGL
uniref:Reverse transcriptase domain-containing protein n=1 Tax=Romanomermis culicivorax TaxID=13658 RepID=A0A915J069_ROMCU